MYTFKIKLLISTPHPRPHYFPSKWHHYPPNHKSSGIRLQSMSGSIHFLFLYITTICCSSHHHLLPRLFIRLPSARHLSVVIITFSNLTQVIAHHYLKCSSGFQFALKQNSNSLTRCQRTTGSGSYFFHLIFYHSPLKILPQSHIYIFFFSNFSCFWFFEHIIVP